MANPSVHSAVVVLLVAVAAVANAPSPALALTDERAAAAAPQWFDETVYRPNCLRIEYDEVCLFDPCGANCGPR